MNPSVSIVLPVYNGERFLAEALDSILAQTFKDFELIAVNDGSTDQSPHIFEQYASKDSRVRVLNTPGNMGLPNALNFGFKHAKGNFWTWTSDDNILLPSCLETLSSTLQKNPKADFVYAGARFIDESGLSLQNYITGPIRALVHRNVIGACFMYRRELAESIGEYSDAWRLVEDHEYWLRAQESGANFIRLDDCLYAYRIHSGQLSQSRKEVMLKIFKLLEHYLRRGLGSRKRIRAKAYLRLVYLHWATSGKIHTQYLRQAFKESWLWSSIALTQYPINRIRKRLRVSWLVQSLRA